MKNKIQEAIERLEAKTERSELDEKMLEMLRRKQEDLGENPTEEDIKEGLHQVMKEYLLFAFRQNSDDNNEDDNSSCSAEVRKEDIRVVREVFQSMGLLFHDYPQQKGVHVFELTVCGDNKKLCMKVYLEAETRMCRIDALYPFIADQVFAYPLCEMLLKENYSRRYGALQYDAFDGELSYRYCFPITHGLLFNDFAFIFMAVVKSALTSYDTVKIYARGRFHMMNVRQQIADKLEDLLNELEH